MAAIAAAACESAPAGLAEETYVEVMAHLTWTRLSFVNQDDADSARSAILERYGVSGPELLHFAERHGRDVERMADIWERIRHAVDSLDAVPEPESEGGGAKLEVPEPPP